MPPPPRRPRNRPNSGGTGNAPKGSESSTGQGDKKQGLQKGALVGIIAGSVLAALIVLLLLVFCIRNDRKKKDDSSSEYKDFVGPLSVNIEEGTTLSYPGIFFLFMYCTCIILCYLSIS
jgi:hypothetical protein